MQHTLFKKEQGPMDFRRLLGTGAVVMVAATVGFFILNGATAEGCGSDGTATYSWDPEGGYRSPTDALVAAAAQDESAILAATGGADDRPAVEDLLTADGPERIEAESGSNDEAGTYLVFVDDGLYASIDIVQLPGGGFAVGSSTICED